MSLGLLGLLELPWAKDSDMGDGERRVEKWTVTNSVHAKLGLAGVITVNGEWGELRVWRSATKIGWVELGKCGDGDGQCKCG